MKVERKGRDSSLCDDCQHGKLNHDDGWYECWVAGCYCTGFVNEADEAFLGFDRW